MTPRKLLTLVLIIGAAGLMATACGRRAPLESPAQAAARAAREARTSGTVAEEKNADTEKPKRFILDPLLD